MTSGASRAAARPAGVPHGTDDSTLLDEWRERYDDPVRYAIGRAVLDHVYPRAR